MLIKTKNKLINFDSIFPYCEYIVIQYGNKEFRFKSKSIEDAESKFEKIIKQFKLGMLVVDIEEL